MSYLEFVELMLCEKQTSNISYFEMLDLPLLEVQGLKTLKISYHNAKTKEVLICSSICRDDLHIKNQSIHIVVYSSLSRIL